MDKEAVGMYRKKPVVVEAMQLPSDSAGFWQVYHWMRDDVAEWDDQPFRIRIRTLEGEMWAAEGDWIIKGVQGEFYPCKPDIFAATYEPALAQQPAAQAAGLTDEQFIAAHGERLAAMLGIKEWWDIADRDARIKAALLSRAAPSGEAVAYVECRECGRCGHTGINDAHSQDECCSNCDWTGPAPKEDVCPGCAQTGTMRAACPKCGSMYRLLCETTVAAPQPSAQQAEPESPMKAAADALRRKTELEQAHQDGYRDGFKAAQAMLAKAEQPAEEARGADAVAELLLSLGWTDRGDAQWKSLEAALPKLRALLAAPAAGTGMIDHIVGYAMKYRNAFEKLVEQLESGVNSYAATGAQGLIALLREARGVVEQQWDESNTAADHDLLQRIDAALAASKEA